MNTRMLDKLAVLGPWRGCHVAPKSASAPRFKALLPAFYFSIALSANMSHILHSALLHTTSRAIVYGVETV